MISQTMPICAISIEFQVILFEDMREKRHSYAFNLELETAIFSKTCSAIVAIFDQRAKNTLSLPQQSLMKVHSVNTFFEARIFSAVEINKNRRQSLKRIFNSAGEDACHFVI